MRSKGLIGLIVVTVAAVVVAVWVSFGSGKAATDPRAGNAVLPELGQRLGDVGRVSLVRGEQKATLLRKDKAWVVEEKGGYPADLLKLRQTLLGLAELRLVEPKTRKAEFHPRLEVEDAGKKDSKSTLITVADEQGKLLGEVIVGKRRIDQLGGGNDGVYVRKPGDAQSWLARGTLDPSGDMASWLDRKVMDVPEAQVKQAVLTAPDGKALTIGRAKPEDKLALVGAPADTKLKSDTALVEPAGALGGLDLTDVRPAKEFEFPQDGVAHAEYTSFDGLAVKVDLVEKDGTNWVRLQASGSGDAVKQATELNAKLTPWVFAVASFKANALKTKLADLVETPKGS